MRETPQGVDDTAPAGRLERLSPLDVSNLRVEDHGLPMHVVALAILEGSPLLDAPGQLRLNELQGMLEQRLDLAPRLRQALHRPRFGLGPPLWVDDAGFDIREHVRTREISAPGDEATLLRVCAELNEPQLDRSRPLWEMWVLTGLADGNVGLLIRLHHVIADGIAALALIGALFDVAPDAPARVPRRWLPRPMPSTWGLLIDNLGQRAAAGARALSRFGRPVSMIRHVGMLIGQGRRLLREGLAPRVSLNRPVGKHRRLLLVRADLDRAKAAAHAHGGKVNDVLLAAVAGGARRLLAHRGELRPGLVLKASVPASMRSPADEPAGGNRVGIMLVPLPVGEPDPIRRLEAISQASWTERGTLRSNRAAVSASVGWCKRCSSSGWSMCSPATFPVHRCPCTSRVPGFSRCFRSGWCRGTSPSVSERSRARVNSTSPSSVMPMLSQTSRCSLRAWWTRSRSWDLCQREDDRRNHSA